MRVRGFGELEAVIMERVWDYGPEASMTVREIFEELAAERQIAYTTVMSTMDNLHTKGWLARERATVGPIATGQHCRASSTRHG
ncbi:transcriptional regulator BlaI [Mycolicibacterium gilvum]|uniref:Transcriptional regulator BlaI n=1 Tax=Mycolicibacterium gilvum TaxID=1804 RepID=A0A378SNK9_9MYCO|nr:transcriptional regulator BlaI [Mycolicibacterium gilvum]